MHSISPALVVCVNKTKLQGKSLVGQAKNLIFWIFLLATGLKPGFCKGLMVKRLAVNALSIKQSLV
jgi:hypothetical protein